MHSRARWSRCGTDEDVFRGRRVRYKPKRRAREQLRDVHDTASDVATDVVGVIVFKIRGRHDVSLQHAVAKTRSEPLHLVLDTIGHVKR